MPTESTEALADLKKDFLQKALRYFVIGKQAHDWALLPECCTVLHHAVEMLLKAAVIEQQGLSNLKGRFGHNLPKLWNATVQTHPDLDSPEMFKAIHSLDRYEEIRYPAIRQGIQIHMSANTPGSHSSTSGDHVYLCSVADVAELFRRLYPRLIALPPQIVIRPASSDVDTTLKSLGLWGDIAEWVGE